MKQKKRFIVRKYVIATSAREAIKKERTQEADDVWIDENWIREPEQKLGFNK